VKALNRFYQPGVNGRPGGTLTALRNAFSPKPKKK
jgi:hypothetical protein